MQDQALNALLREVAQLESGGQIASAIDACRRFLDAYPESPEIWCELGRLLRGAGKAEEALSAFSEAIRFGIETPEEIQLTRAVILTDSLRRDDDAERALQAALEARPGYPPAILNFGNLHEERGRREAAIAAYRQIIPSAGAGQDFMDLRLMALARLARLERPRGADDPRLADIRTALAEGFMQADVRAQLSYTLGEALDAIGAYDDAFAAFDAANDAQRASAPPVSRRAIAEAFARIRRAFSSPAASEAGASNAPVFICGMLRSGSTLVEQVLAAHPDVVAGGELNALYRLVAREIVPFPEAAASIAPDEARRLADLYFAEIDEAFAGARSDGKIVTDKRPDNFLRIGLIMKLFPGARVIHSVRDARDTCLSNYFQQLEPRLAGYATSLSDLGFYYREYEALMRLWKAQYPHAIFDFDYDAFVREPRATVDALLNFLGLPWREECLEFHRLDNSVKTASYWQVRQPLYVQSSGRWKNYEAHLGPLFRALSGQSQT